MNTRVSATPKDLRIMRWAARVLLVLAAGMGVVWALTSAARHPMWSVQSITVAGDVRHQNEVKLRAQLSGQLEGTFLTIDLDQVRQLVAELPWVRTAQVQRVFPNGLRITIEEHQPVAWWMQAGSGTLVNRQGELFEAYLDDEPGEADWSELAGPPEMAQQVFAAHQKLQPIFARIPMPIQRLEFDTQGSWSLTLKGGARVELGQGETAAIAERASDFVSTLALLLPKYGRSQFDYADLRYSNGYALRLNGINTLRDARPHSTRQ